jgi:hypothetical protein
VWVVRVVGEERERERESWWECVLTVYYPTCRCACVAFGNRGGVILKKGETVKAEAPAVTSLELLKALEADGEESKA